MDVGAILSRSFSLYRRNLNLILPHLVEYALDLLVLLISGLFAAIVLVLVLGSITVGSIMSLLSGPTPFLLIALAIFAIVALVLTAMFFNACARAAIIGMVIESRKDGKTSLNTGLKSARKHGLGIFGYTLAIVIIPAIVIGAIWFISAVLIAAFSPGGMEAGFGTNFASITLIIFLTVLCIISYIIIYVLALFSPQKIVIEEHGIVGGIRASFGFVKEHPTGVVIYIGVAVAVAVITTLTSMLLGLPAIVFEYVDQFIALFFRVLENIVSIAIGLLVAPYLEAVKTLMVLEAGGEKNEVEESPVL